MRKLQIIGDADGLIAFINPFDANNHQAANFVSFLEEQHATLSFPTTAVAEAITTLQRKHASPPLAQQVIDHCRAGSIGLTAVDDGVIATAITLYSPHGSKQNTFFDAIVAAVAKLQQADAIFSFDEWYTKQKFQITSDFLEAK